ncbi:Retrovirus-related Pol polyprotein from transposon TNT 1-94 [Quillaja saponaria]|uniref:Retrovirus-related Pol polyprotein from transposon TNT 1-94 n=1 Tax=Quillaja saponaria TaxID=32244 RepID=A0AAD7L280_QUISA|nr:Retrovirus-related Pol polyprotein from transposon TNT 1-94 [Quillaja saponaria]
MVCTWPDNAHAVGIVKRYLSNPGMEHWEAVKWILRYLRGASNKCLCFGDSKPVLEGFAVVDYGQPVEISKRVNTLLFFPPNIINDVGEFALINRGASEGK